MSSMDAAAPPVSGAKLYRAVWRWHFYAGLFVIPFLMMLAVTGLVMLWVTAISPEFGDRLAVASSSQPLTVQVQADAALKAYPSGRLGQYIAPYGPENPAIFKVELEAGARMLAVNPYDGTVLRDTAKEGTWNELATNIHSKLLWGGDGGPGETLIEIAASLGILLLATGTYLWWPRGANSLASSLLPDFRLTGRAFWKSLHSATGIWISAVLLFFLISGLAWTDVWGGRYVQAWNTFPAEKWDSVPLSGKPHHTLNSGSAKEVPWTLEQTPLPASKQAAGVAKPGAVTLESVVALAREIGFGGRFQLAFPADDTGVWTLSQDSMSYDSTDPFSDRTVHIDQYSGKVLAQAAYKDYPALGKAMAVGIALHQGQMGLWNIAANFLLCSAVMLICLSGIIMWWQRRPAKMFGSPLYAKETRIPAAVLVLGVALAAAFPLGGAAILAFAVIDFLLPKKWKQSGVSA
jgi:uncharacterized iron-regulated membrane protein